MKKELLIILGIAIGAFIFVPILFVLLFHWISFLLTVAGI